MGHVLILEDDASASGWLESAIRRELTDLASAIEIVETESEFVLEWLPQFDQGMKPQPSVIVIDIMLRWTDPAPQQPPRPPEVIQGGFMRAGLRCLESIRQRPKLLHVPVVLYTALTREDLFSLGGKPDGVQFVQKGDGQAVLGPIRAALARPIA